MLHEGVNVIIYGRDSTVAELSKRQRDMEDEIEHWQEVSKADRVREAEKRLDKTD